MNKHISVITRITAFNRTCDGNCHILRREKEKRRRSLLACCQLPSLPRRQLHVEVGARLHLLPSGLGARQRDPVMDLPCPSPRKPRPSRSQRHVRQRQHLLLPPLSKQLEPLKQRRLIQVQLHCLQQQQFLSRHPRAARHSPWCRTLHTGPTGTPSASPAAGTQRDSSGHSRPAGTFLIHCAPRPLNYFLPSASAERHKNHSGVTFSLC